MAEHDITIVRDEIREYPVTVNDDGDIIVSELLGETLDITLTSLHCSHCGRLSPDEYEDHNISDEWNEV